MRTVNLMKSKKFIYIITITYMFLILVLSLKSGSKVEADGIASQILFNFLHIPVYAIMTYLVLQCFSILSYKVYAISFAISFSHGVLVEFLQILVPSRTVSLMDIGLNSIGALSALLFYYKLYAKCYTLNAN